MGLLATTFERKMRGGAQSHLLGCADGGFYVVKFRDNPQHRRILLNEWLASHFLKYLQVATPETRVVELEEAFLRRAPEVSIRQGQQAVAARPGRHFGSRFPGHPERDAVYDFLPDSLLAQVANLTDFRGALVFDKWACNADSRQAIFCRQRLRDLLGPDAAAGNRKGFAALMVDHGFILSGPRWELCDAPLQGLYFRPAAYCGVRSMQDFDLWLSRLAAMPEAVFDQALRSAPQEWFEDDHSELEVVLEKLYRRRARVAELVEAAVRARPSHFPDWGRP